MKKIRVRVVVETVAFVIFALAAISSPVAADASTWMYWLVMLAGAICWASIMTGWDNKKAYDKLKEIEQTADWDS